MPSQKAELSDGAIFCRLGQSGCAISRTKAFMNGSRRRARLNVSAASTANWPAAREFKAELASAKGAESLRRGSASRGVHPSEILTETDGPALLRQRTPQVLFPP